MDAGERFDNIAMFGRMMRQTQVRRVWKLDSFIEDYPPEFDFDTDVAYLFLGMMAAAELQFAHPVTVNFSGLAETFDLELDHIYQYFLWFERAGILKRYAQ